MFVGGLLGGVALFLLGWLIYGIILAGSMEGAPCMRAHGDEMILWIAIGNIFTGLLIGYAFSKMASVNSFGSGAMTGAIMGLLLAIGYDCLMYGISTLMESPTEIIMDAVLTAVMWAIAGGVVGWWMGRGAKTA